MIFCPVAAHQLAKAGRSANSPHPALEELLRAATGIRTPAMRSVPWGYFKKMPPILYLLSIEEKELWGNEKEVGPLVSGRVGI
jgi:hypothetical protein